MAASASRWAACLRGRRRRANDRAYEFRGDCTFRHVDGDGKTLATGVFFDDRSGQVRMVFRHWPERNVLVSTKGSQMVLHYERPEQYERVV